ncbi:MAG: hypothetical protein R3A79_07140 [Nannocystaceae bacterium]
MHALRRHAITASPLALALWIAWPNLAHARRGFPLFIIISDNPALLLIGLALAGVWAYFRFFAE